MTAGFNIAAPNSTPDGAFSALEREMAEPCEPVPAAERFADFVCSEPFYSASQSVLLVLFGIAVGLCAAAATGWSP